MRTGRIVSKAQIEGLITAAEMKQREATAVEFDRMMAKRLRRTRFSKGHILSVVKYMPHIRRCRRRGRVPRSVPKKVMATVFALALV